MQAKKENDFTKEAGVYFEHNICVGGWTYMLIFGCHANGGWICIPNHSLGCEASDCVGETRFNKEKLVQAGAVPEEAEAIAQYIDAWLEENKDRVEKIRTEAQERFLERISNSETHN